MRRRLARPAAGSSAATTVISPGPGCLSATPGSCNRLILGLLGTDEHDKEVRPMATDTKTEIRELLGMVPGFFENPPGPLLDSEWESFKSIELRS